MLDLEEIKERLAGLDIPRWRRLRRRCAYERFMANAPEDIRALVAEVENVRRVLAEQLVEFLKEEVS